MERLSRYVPSARHLWVFDVTAKAGSFTAAAESLNVSQPAVSKCIRQLENALGVSLFSREHRRVRLTEPGAKLHNVVSRGFEEVIAVAQELQTYSRANPVTLSVPSAFANYCLIPRLAIFHAKNPEIDLRVQTTDREGHLDDVGISFEVRRGSADWPGIGTARLADEVISPIASKAFLAKHGPISSPAQLQGLPLIHLEEPVRNRVTWRRWFDQFGVPFDEKGGGLRLNDYTMVLHAAVAGEGIALGWHHITEELTRGGFLQRLEHLSWQTGMGFHLCWSQLRQQSGQETCVRAWLMNELQGHPPR
ncbi:hypothetical protein X742_27030 [Mesorhizobium sp. LNHC232B00]|nr:hypothetical protein X742_27030 [Mesorhizobium sp. LNHC232B00]